MKRRFFPFALVVVMALLLAVPASGATAWQTKASANSRGAAYWHTDSIVQTVVNKPHAIRLGFRTTNGKANTVRYSYGAFCENASKSADDRKITTKADNSWTYVTIYKGGSGLGRFCDVSLFAGMKNTARLHTRIQAKHP